MRNGGEVRGAGGGRSDGRGMDLCVERILQYAGLPESKDGTLSSLLPS